MFLIKNNKVYVNKSDVRFLLTNYKSLNVPEEITDAIAGISDDPCTVVDSNGKVYKGDGMCFTGKDDNDWIGFSNKVCKEYLKNHPFMINYEKYLNMDDTSIEDEFWNTVFIINEIENRYAELTDEDKKSQKSIFEIRVKLLSHLRDSIRKMIDIKNKHITIPLPPDEIITDNGPTGPVKVARKDMKHVWFAEKAIFKFDLQDMYKHTYIRH